MTGLSDEQRRVLKMLRKRHRSATEMRTGIRTLLALADRRLIWVPCTIDNIAFPRKAVAEITEAGLAAIAPRKS